MAKSLTLGNGHMLVSLDEFGLVRDLYFPYVGLENHVGGHFVHRVGVYVEGVLHWLSDGTWKLTVGSEPETLVGRIVAEHEKLDVVLEFSDVVYNERNIFIRRIAVTNRANRRRDIKLYLGHEFEIYESHAAHTAYFDPVAHALVHYRGRRVFLANAISENTSFTDYTTGVFKFKGMEGSYRDADDGELSKNPIEHGQADSVLGVYLTCEAGASKLVHYWLTVGCSIAEARELNDYVFERNPDHFVESTRNYWKAWVNRQGFSFHGLSDRVVALFKQSLLIVRAHTDNHGAIIASGDSAMLQQGKDTYAYMWPRDGALAAMALYKSGANNAARRFFEFANDIVTEEGYFMHKYGPDGALGSSWHPWIQDGNVHLPIQEDETALILFTLWQYYDHSKDLEFVEDVYNSLIKRSADFMVEHTDKETGLPKPSYDLWEEKYGVHTFTAASVYGGLTAASRFAGVLGKDWARKTYAEAAERIKQAILANLYDAKSGHFRKRITIDGNGKRANDDVIDASSAYGIYLFGVLPPDDERVSRSMRLTRERLTVRTKIGGIARYEGDRYNRSAEGVIGNPWIITTLWAAEYAIDRAKSEADLTEAKQWFEWVADRALRSGVLPEQVDSYTGGSISAAPLTWSHAAFVSTVIRYLDRLEELGICLACNPVR